jgi:hypothetical protein
MSCEELQDQFVSYLLGELSPAEAHAVDTHLASSCANCHEEFEAVREALELVFEAVPVAKLSHAQRQRISQEALRKTSPEFNHRTPLSTPPQAGGPIPEDRLTIGLFQALLAIAAGFFLMVGWQAITRKQPHLLLSQQEHNPSPDNATEHQNTGLSGGTDLPPGSNESVHYVSLKMRPAQATVHGYCLEDTFSGQTHIVGNINRAPMIGEQFRLTVFTDIGETEIPIAVDESGRFMKIFTTPQGAIRDILLQASVAKE